MSHAESKKLKKNVKPDQETRKDEKSKKSNLIAKGNKKVAVGVAVPTSV